MTTETKEKPKGLPKLVPSRIALATSKYNRWLVCPPQDDKYEDLFNPDYWAHCAFRVQPCDIIEVIPEDMTYRAELFVVSTGQTHVRVKEINKIELGDALADEDESQYRVTFNGPHDRFTVFRGAEKIEPGFATREDAHKHVATLIKKVV